MLLKLETKMAENWQDKAILDALPGQGIERLLEPERALDEEEVEMAELRKERKRLEKEN